MIYKGIQKRIILLKNTGSDYFEEAYFIIKDEADGKSVPSGDENDMIKEANRIISETFSSGRCLNTSVSESRKRRGSRGFWYMAGVLCGAALTFVFDFFFLG
jgi:hypothetical protein